MSLLALASIAAGGGCSSTPDQGTLKVLINGPSGITLASLDLRVYQDGGLLRQQTFAKPQLPGGLQLTALPTQGRLRVIVAGLDGGGAIKYLAGSATPLPLPSNQLSLVLSDAAADGDGDGVPDELDDCPSLPDVGQESAAGFGNGPGDACVATQHDMTPDMAPAPQLPVAGGPSKCPGATLICDPMDALRPGEGFLNTAAVFDTGQIFRGDHALHVTNDTHLVIQTSVNLPQPDTYLRAFVYIPSPMPTNQVTLLRVQQSEGSFFAVELQLVGGKLRTRASRTETLENSNVAPPLDRWFCVQWQVHVDTQGFTDLKVDGVPVPGLDAASTFDTTNTPAYRWIVSALDSVDDAGTHPATDAWFDEVAVDFKPISCTD
jgi:hypothetical protein